LPGRPGDPENEQLPAVVRTRGDARFAWIGLVLPETIDPHGPKEK